MTGGKTFSDKEMGQIQAFKQANYSIREIGKELNRSKNVVWNYLKAPEEYRTKNNHGRPKKLTIRQQRLLVRKASTGKFSANQIRNELDLKICKSTVLSYLRANGILLYEKRLMIPALKNHHKLARVEWAITMLSNRDGWGNIIFSDEKKFILDGLDDHQFYWHDLRLEKDIFQTKSWSRIGDLRRNFQ